MPSQIGEHAAVESADMSLSPLPPPGSKRAYWICQVAGWYGYALIQIIAAVMVAAVPWELATVELLALYTAGLALSHALRAFMRRWRWDALSGLELTPRVLLAGLVLSIPLGLSQHFMAVARMRQADLGLSASMELVLESINWAPIFWAWMTMYFIVLSSRKRRYAELRQSELARELQSAELRLLKSQLNPHFLFNSLNSVRALISEDPSRAQHAVTQLARTLRYTLGASSHDELVSLEQELAMVDDYLGLESLRLGERLKVERKISGDALRVRVPVMLLQTVVENAIKHGIAELPSGGVLRMSAHLRNGSLMLQVENPRPAGSAQRAPHGLGLRNGAERLRLLFGDGGNLDLDLSAADRAVARIRIPLLT